MERTIQLVQPMKLAERKLLRVAAYARVSCDKDAMKHWLLPWMTASIPDHYLQIFLRTSAQRGRCLIVQTVALIGRKEMQIVIRYGIHLCVEIKSFRDGK